MADNEDVENKFTVGAAYQGLYKSSISTQDHRAIKRLTKLMLNFKSFRSARKVLSGIKMIHMIRKGQMILTEGNKMSFAEQF